MMLPFLLLFFLFLLLSAFFSSSETAFLSSNSYKLDNLSQKGSSKAKIVQTLLKKVDTLLATILVGNTLVNTAAASLSTYIFLSFFRDKNKALLVSTLVTSFLLLVFSEITPKTYAAFNPIRLSLLFARPLRLITILISPLVKVFVFIPRLIFPSHKINLDSSRSLNKDEAKQIFSVIPEISNLRKKMISGVLDIGTRPVREIMIPRPRIKAIDLNEDNDFILNLIRSTGFSRFPVFQHRIDNILGMIHAKDIIPFLLDGKKIEIKELLRKPFFIPESAPMEQVFLQMQKTVNHMVFVVDEFGNLEGLLTLEDIFEEIVGEIRDEYDVEAEEMVEKIGEGIYFVKGNTPIKLVNKSIPLCFPEKVVYTTFAGFFLDEFGRIPKTGDILEYKGSRLIVEKMTLQRINLIKIILGDIK